MVLVRVLIFLLAVITLSVLTTAGAGETPLHLDRKRLPFGCGTCHVGVDFRSGGGTVGCLSCHSNALSLPKSLVAPGASLKDIGPEFKKTYRHPTLEVRGVHASTEELPESNPRAPRHADCVDCHNPHALVPGNWLAGIRRKSGNQVAEITHDYELCYKCHGDSANLPPRSTNKRADFSLNNPSYHPVEGEGRNQQVVSLLKPYKEKKITASDVSVITCTTCHGSENPDSPRGPHGSNNQYILTDAFSTKDGETESPYVYAICYRCHSRTSILSDESFRYHSLHIKGRGGASLSSSGTSCFTCHSSHGSTENKYLIRFNRDVVTMNSKGLLKFVEKGVYAFHGECYLSCHGVDHDPKSY